jgi:hypothetical protein
MQEQPRELWEVVKRHYRTTLWLGRHLTDMKDILSGRQVHISQQEKRRLSNLRLLSIRTWGHIT